MTEEVVHDQEVEQQEVEEAGVEPQAGEDVAQEADELSALREELEAAKAKEAEYLDGWQRARAELANARKRFQREREQTYSSAQGDLFTRLLPVVDDFERAFDTLPDDLSGLTWVDGMFLIQRKLQMLLEQSAVKPIEAVGCEFDPFAHQAVTHEPSESVPEGHVVGEMQRGYMMAERVLRPSMVRVSSGPLPQSVPEPERELAEDDDVVNAKD